jgi:hypothetical protein
MAASAIYILMNSVQWKTCSQMIKFLFFRDGGTGVDGKQSDQPKHHKPRGNEGIFPAMAFSVFTLKNLHILSPRKSAIPPDQFPNNLH